MDLKRKFEETIFTNLHWWCSHSQIVIFAHRHHRFQYKRPAQLVSHGKTSLPCRALLILKVITPCVEERSGHAQCYVRLLCDTCMFTCKISILRYDELVEIWFYARSQVILYGKYLSIFQKRLTRKLAWLYARLYLL